MSTRQERRRQERLAKKQPKKGHEYNQWAEGKGKQKTYNMDVQLIQPWSVPIFRTTLPPEILQTMIEISDQVIADKETKSHGEYLAGQIDSELLVEHNLLEQTGVMGFFMGAVRQFVIQCKCQMMPTMIEAVQREEWLIQMLTMWIISQQPGEYNPMHIHTQCQISSVMYLKVPKMLPSKKEHRPLDDGSILFVSNTSRDLDLSVPNIVIPPQAGDFYIFGAQQQHAVYPYRCEEGDPERRSISFNAVFQSKADFDRGEKLQTNNEAVVPPGKSRPE
jgi:uncharacterized protein (TIGR02466 family)